MLVHSLASKYARFVVIVRQIYWTPPFRPLDPPLLKSDDLFLGNQEILDPPLSKILDTPLLTLTYSEEYMMHSSVYLKVPYITHTVCWSHFFVNQPTYRTAF